MPQLIEETEHDFQEDYNEERRNKTEQRARLKASLPTIAAEVTSALHDAGIVMAVFFTVPSSGSLLTFATPLDPDDATWATVSDIVNQIVSRAAGVDHLICEEAACVAAGVTMAAADLVADSDAFNMDY